MKLNKLFVSALAALAFVACSKDGETGAEGPESGQGMSVTISLRNSSSAAAQAAGKGTRSSETDFTETTTITLKKIKVFFADADGNIVDDGEFTDEQIGDKLAVFHGINPSATQAIAAANYGELLSSTPATITALKATKLTLVDYQKSKLQEEVPLMSEAAALEENTDKEHPDTAGETDEEVTWCKVSLDLVPVLSRIEIGGNLTITSDMEGEFVYTAFTMANVGLNGLFPACTLGGDESGERVYTNTNATGFPDTGDTSPTPTWMYDALPNTNLIEAVGNSAPMDKVYAYNVMPGDKPEITLQFNSTPRQDLPEDAPVPVSPKAYIKIVNFAEGAVNNPMTLEPGKIYKIEDISFNQDKVTMLDNQVLCVEVAVTVQNWEIVDVENPEFGE